MCYICAGQSLNMVKHVLFCSNSTSDFARFCRAPDEIHTKQISNRSILINTIVSPRAIEALVKVAIVK